MITLREVSNRKYMNYYMCEKRIEDEVTKAAEKGDNEVYVYLTCTKTILKNLIANLDQNGFEIVSGLKRMEGEYTVRYIRIRW